MINQDSLEFGLRDSGMFRGLLGFTCQLAGQGVKLSIDPSGILINTTDRSMTVFLQAHLHASMFSDYSLTGAFAATFDSVALSRILKSVDSTVGVKIGGELVFEMTERGAERKFAIPQIVDTEASGDIPSLPSNVDLDFDTSIGVLKQLVYDVDAMGLSDVTFTWDGDGVRVEARTDSMSRFEMLFKDVSYRTLGSGTACFRVDLLKDFVKMPLGKIRFCVMGKDMPMFLECKEEGYSLKYVIAPFVREQADNEPNYGGTSYEAAS